MRNRIGKMEKKLEDKRRHLQDFQNNGDPNLFAFAQNLRATETKAEQMLWTRLSKNQLGVKFRRQHPIHSFVIDFYCHKYKIVIELDGPIHDTEEQRMYDKNRTDVLRDFGIVVLRFRNEEVFTDIDKVIEKIQDHFKRNE